MLQLKRAINAWNTDRFNSEFTQQVMQQGLDQLPLQQALALGSYANLDEVQLMINSTCERHSFLDINCGIFFSSTIAGCNCADDPTPLDTHPEYCEVRFSINRDTLDTQITLIESND